MLISKVYYICIKSLLTYKKLKGACMSEPSLETISDYKNIDSEKKRMIMAIIFSTIIMGIVYAIVSNVYGTVDDAIVVEETIKTMPLR